jgi:hypothetical protein
MYQPTFWTLHEHNNDCAQAGKSLHRQGLTTSHLTAHPTLPKGVVHVVRGHGISYNNTSWHEKTIPTSMGVHVPDLQRVFVDKDLLSSVLLR